MKKLLLYLGAIVSFALCAHPAKAQLINCPSGFTTSGACGVSTSTGAQTFWNQNALSGSESVIIPPNCTHCGQSMNTQSPVNVQAFTATWTFIPNEWNGAFVLQNNVNNQASGAICSGTHCGFSAGAGCEAGFYQAFNSSNKSTDHIFALTFFDNYSDRTSSSGFVYSTVQITQPQQSPCNPNDGQPWYWSTSRISTSPVPTTSPATSENTSTGHLYSAKLVYDGSTLTYTMFDVTAGGSCPGVTCFTQSWNNVNIPSMVGSNTAYLGLAGGTGNSPTPVLPMKVDSLVYTVNTPPSVPSFQTYTSATAAGTPHAAAPTFSPVAGSYSGTQSVTISSATSGAYFCYTLAASPPSLMPFTDQVGGCTVGTLYTGAVSVASTQTLYAMAGTVANTPGTAGTANRANSDLTVGTFTIGSTAAAPTASPVPGTYSSTQTVTLTTTTGGATICYTIDGSTPLAATPGTCSHGTTYSGTISVATTQTIKAIATISGSTNSAVQSFAYTITPSAACTLAPNYQSVSNLPGFGFTALAGQIITPNVIVSGCPSFNITNLGISGGAVSATGSGFTFSTNDWVIITTQNSFPYQQLSNTLMQIASATATTFTTKPITNLLPLSSGAVTMTAIQFSLINYSVANTIGSITGTLGCTTNCGAATTLTVGSTPANGNCTFTGSGPTFTGVTSTQALTVTATAVVGGSSTTIPVYVCSAPILPQIPGPLYYQNYVGQTRHLASFVWGTTNQQSTWSNSGPCTLSNTAGSRDVVVTFTGTGYCTVTQTSVADATKSQTTSIYVPAALPSYGDVIPGGAGATPCALDANLTGGDFEVGAGKTYTTIGAVPWNNASLMVPGSTVRIYNTATGTGQTVYTEGWQIVFGGTLGQPIHVCAMPNAAGYPPILEASGAVFPSWTSTFAAGFGLVNLQTNNGSLGLSCFGYYPSPSCGPNYVLFNGFQIQNVVGPNTWSITGGGSGTWGSGADAINVRQGSYVAVEGNVFINSEQCVGTYNNANGGWAAMTQMVDIGRNSMSNCGGRSGDSTSHPAYLQSYGMFFHENVIGNAPTGDAGSGIKDRNIGAVIVGNYVGTGYARQLDRVEDQDSYQYVDVNGYAQEGFPAAGDTWGVNGVTQFQYQLYTDVVAYNIFNNSTGTSFTPFHMLADHDNNAGSYGMNSFYGHLWFSFNTYWGPGQLFDQNNSFGDNRFLSATAHSQNNIDWLPPSTPCQMAYQSDAITNIAISHDLWLTGAINNTAPIIGDHFNFFTSDNICGWVGDTIPNNYWGNRPLDSHVSGQGSLFFTNTQPFTTGTFALPGGSAAIGVAAVLTGEAALFPRRFNAISTAGVLTPCTTMTDLGAICSGVTPPPANNTTLHGTVTLRGTLQ